MTLPFTNPSVTFSAAEEHHHLLARANLYFFTMEPNVCEEHTKSHNKKMEWLA